MLALAAAVLLLLSPLRAFAGDEAADVRAFLALQQRLARSEKSAPLDAIQQYANFWQADPGLHPVAAARAQAAVARVYYDSSLKDPKSALTVTDASLTRWPKEQPVRLLLVAEKARVLLGENRAREAGSLLNENWSLVLTAGENIGAENVATLIGLHSRALIALGQVKEAQPWARLSWTISPCEPAAVRASAAVVERALLAADPTRVRLRRFVRAQAAPDPAARGAIISPLSEIALPPLNAALLKGGEGAVETPRQMRDRVTFFLLSGRLRPAMEAARTWLAAHPDDEDGVREVCRVFKAADGSLRRANAALAFLRTGKGEDPLPAFANEYPASAAGIGTAVSLPGAVPGATRVVAVHEAHVRVPLVLNELRGKTLTADAAWENGLLRVDDLLRAFDDGLIPPTALFDEDNVKTPTPNREIARLLAQHGGARIRRPDALSRNARLYLGDYYRRVKDSRAPLLFQSVLDEAGTAVVYDDYVVLAHTRLARFLRETGNRTRAAEVYRDAPRYYSDPAWLAWAARDAALVYEEMGDRASAQEMYEKVEEYGQAWATATARVHQARRMMREGDHDGAQELLSKPVAGQEEQAARISLGLTLAHSFYRTGNFAAATKHLNAVLEARNTLPRSEHSDEAAAMAASAATYLTWIRRWEQTPILIVNKPLRWTPSPYKEKYVMARLTVRSVHDTPLAAKTGHRDIFAEPENSEWKSDSPFYAQTTIMIYAPAEFLPGGVTTTLTVTSAEYPAFRARVPLRIKR